MRLGRVVPAAPYNRRMPEPHIRPHTTPEPVRVEVLTALFQVRRQQEAAEPQLCVLLRPVAMSGATWSLPDGDVPADTTLENGARRLVTSRLDGVESAHLEQLAVFSAPHRVPGTRTIASAYLALLPSDIAGTPVDGAAWHAVEELPELAYDHAEVVEVAQHRLAAKLSYTNIAFALAPQQFPMSELSDIYCAALGYPVDTTNLLRILSRRGVVVATGTVGKTGRSGGRPPALYAFAESRLRVTDEFATLRPPM